MARFSFVILFTSFFYVVTSKQLFGDDDANFLFNEASGKDCNWVAEKPEKRCARKDKKKKWDSVCEVCPKTCSAAGFVSGHCDPIRAVSDIRFNKLPPIADNKWSVPNDDYVSGVHKKVYPMLPDDYPFTDIKLLAKVIPSETMADSVILLGDTELKRKTTAAEWLADPNNYLDQPTYPGDTDGKYWEELEHVVDVQIKRRNGVSPSDLNRWPDIWKDLESLADIASAVAGEYPALHQQTFIGTLFKAGIEMFQYSRPFRSHVDFVGAQVCIAEINTWAFHAVAPINFMLKWHVGMPRPEEMAWLISRGEFTSADDGVPEDVVDKIKSMNLEVSTDFTAYDDVGCPTHPSWPAMHSAGSTVSYWLPAIVKITPEQYCEALRVDYAVSYGRTIAGVHYQQDNIAGLNIGQRIIREELPKMLDDMYGYDSKKIATVLDGLSFDWSTFDPGACSIGGVSTADFLAAAVPDDDEQIITFG